MSAKSGGDAEQARLRFDQMLNGTTPESAALQILRAVERNQRRALVGPDAKIMDVMVRMIGSWYQPITAMLARRLLEG